MIETSSIFPFIFAAILVEGLVNVAQSVKEKETNWKYWVSLALGLAAGIVAALNYDLDLFELVGLEGQYPAVGAVMTGLVISRGANFASDLIGRINTYGRG